MSDGGILKEAVDAMRRENASISESNDAEKKDIADFGRADVICLEDRKAIERFKFLLKEYGLEFDENLTETARLLKQAVLDALPPTMRKDAERITLIKDKCHDLRGILDSMYPVELPDYARYSSLRDLADDIEIYVEGGEPSHGATVSETSANAEGQDSATAEVRTDSREGA